MQCVPEPVGGWLMSCGSVQVRQIVCVCVFFKPDSNSKNEYRHQEAFSPALR